MSHIDQKNYLASCSHDEKLYIFFQARNTLLELILLFIGILSKVYPTYFLRKNVEEDFTPMYFCRVNLSLSSLPSSLDKNKLFKFGIQTFHGTQAFDSFNLYQVMALINLSNIDF